MRWLSMATRKEPTATVAARYRTSDRAKKARIIDKFVDITGFHRKHAIRLLGGQDAIRVSCRSLCGRVDILWPSTIEV